MPCPSRLVAVYLILIDCCQVPALVLATQSHSYVTPSTPWTSRGPHQVIISSRALLDSAMAPRTHASHATTRNCKVCNRARAAATAEDDGGKTPVNYQGARQARPRRSQSLLPASCRRRRRPARRLFFLGTDSDAAAAVTAGCSRRRHPLIPVAVTLHAWIAALTGLSLYAVAFVSNSSCGPRSTACAWTWSQRLIAHDLSL